MTAQHAGFVGDEWHRVYQDDDDHIRTECDDEVVPEFTTIIGVKSLVDATSHPHGCGICNDCLFIDKCGQSNGGETA